MSLLGKLVVLKTSQGEFHDVAEAIGYTERPTYLIEDKTGKIGSWIAELCREATLEEQVEYWQRLAKERANASRTSDD